MLHKHTDIQTDRQTDRPSDEVGCRGAFAPKNRLYFFLHLGILSATVKDVLFESFEAFLNLIYGGKTSLVLECSDFNRLFEIWKLGDMYQVNGIPGLVEARIKIINVSRVNVFEAIRVAEKYKELNGFESLSSTLKLRYT